MEEVILIVEDELKNMKLINDLLKVNGYSTIKATNGKQAVEIAMEKRPDLILMDIQMPVMGGIEATKILKSDNKTRHIPVIALTAYAMDGDEKRIYEAGCDDYISKPIEIKIFLRKVKEYLSG